MSKEFSLPIRIYYEDTDAGGIVYNANYVKFLERCRTEWLRSLGVEQDVLLDRGIAFVVRRIELDFIKPAKFNDMIEVSAEVEKLGRASLVFSQKILDASDGALLASASVKIGCVDLGCMKPIAMPAEIKEIIEKWKNQ